MNLNSSNPVLKNQDLYAPSDSMAGENVASVQGVVNKTSILVAIAIVTGSLAYAYLPVAGSAVMISSLVAFVVVIGASFIIAGNPRLAPTVAPIYAAVEGVFLGSATRFFDVLLANALAGPEGAVPAWIAEGSLALPAFIISMSCVVTMLALYTTGIIRATERFKAVMAVLVVGCMLTYVASFLLSFVGVSIPFFSVNSALEGGTSALIGIGVSVLFLGIASLMLIIDFDRVEKIVDSGAPKYMEWFGAFGLMVTLAWIYFEALKLAFRLALILGSRD